VAVDHVFNFTEIERILKSPQGPVAKDLIKRGLRVESAAKMNLQKQPKRVDTGRLRSSISTKLLTVSGDLTVRVGTAVRYAAWVHDGTGLYGPRHQYIVPVNKKVLRWKQRKASHYVKTRNGYVYTARSSGMRPNPFMKNALSAFKI